MHQNLTAAGNFCKIFLWNIQKLNAADIFQFLRKFACSMLNFPCLFPNITCNQNLVIVIIYSFHGFSIVPPENVHTQGMFLVM